VKKISALKTDRPGSNIRYDSFGWVFEYVRAGPGRGQVAFACDRNLKEKRKGRLKHTMKKCSNEGGGGGWFVVYREKNGRLLGGGGEGFFKCIWIRH